MFRLYKLVKRYWWQLAIIVVLVATQTLLQLQLPDYITTTQNIVNNIGETGITRAEINEMLKQSGIMLLISLGIFALAAGQGSLNSKFVATLGKEIRAEVFKKVENFSLSDVNEFGTASLLTRLINDSRAVQEFAFMVNRVFIMSPIFLIIGSVKLLTLDPMYFYVVIVIIPLIIIVLIITFAVASPLFTQIQERVDYVTLLLREGLTGVRVIRAFNQEERENRFFDEGNRKMTDIIIKVSNVMQIISPIINILFNLVFFGIYLIGFVLFDKMLLGVIPFNMNAFSQTITAMMYAQHIMMSFMMLSFTFIMFPRVKVSAKRINAVLNVKPNIVDPEAPLDKELIDTGIVKFENVTFTFSDLEHPTLKNINFTAEPGTTTAIVGSTGSGKSSIINLLPRFFDASVGKVTFDGYDVRDFKLNDLRDKIGFVPQTAVLFKGTIRDNLRFGNENATDEEMWEALRVAQAAGFVSKLELGLDAPVAQGGKNFSGGQRQRLAIARALVRKPKIYVFDDSFSALDFKTDIRLRSALKDYAKDATIFVVAQRVNSILDAHQILVLDNGEVAGIGKHADLLNSCKVYQEIVTSQLDPEEIKKSRDMFKDFTTEGGKA
ncbi:MAG TPA: ABC transporter ATP-binding protein [Bacilli bacterium]|nr:ABC transporter ATP-binding protein [Bacilli bacterium]HPK28403.1 ABC transporter ATP-binding protein [Bacilli bacterium]